MSDSSPPPPKRSLVAPIVCSGLFVLAGILHALFAIVEHGATAFAAGMATASVLAPLVVAGLIGIFRRDAFFPMLGVISVLGLGGTTGSSSRAATERAQRKEALAALEARMAEMRAKSNAAFWSGGEEVTDADIARIVADIDRLAGKVPPADAAVFRCSAEGLRDLAKVASANRSATDALSDAATLAGVTRAILQERIARVGTAKEARAALTRKLDTFVPDLSRCLARHQLPEPQVAGIVRGASAAAKGSAMERLLRVSAAEATYLTALGSLLDVVDAAWGTWRLDKNTGEIAFERDDTRTRYNEAASALDRAAEELDAAREAAVGGPPT